MPKLVCGSGSGGVLLGNSPFSLVPTVLAIIRNSGKTSSFLARSPPPPRQSRTYTYVYNTYVYAHIYIYILRKYILYCTYIVLFVPSRRFSHGEEWASQYYKAERMCVYTYNIHTAPTTDNTYRRPE